MDEIINKKGTKGGFTQKDDSRFHLGDLPINLNFIIITGSSVNLNLIFSK